MNTSLPLIPDSAPFSPEQRAWLNGFFAGAFSRTGPAAVAVPAPTLTPLTILFGSQTGTAEGLAKRAAKEAVRLGFAATVVDMAQIDAPRLASEKNVLVIVSTYGDGEPPDAAKALHTALAADDDPACTSLRFSVCALGDTNYAQFCKCGADFDDYLEKRGGTRIAPRVDCDLDYDEKFSAWLSTVLGLFTAVAPGAPAALNVGGAATPAETKSADAEPAFSRSRPFPALLLTSRVLNGVGSAKQVNHIEFDLDDSDLTYAAGDALGVMPQNSPKAVSDILTALGCDGEEAVPGPAGTTASLRHALTEFYDLGKPTAEMLALVSPRAVPVVAIAGANEAAGPTSAIGANGPFHVIDALLARAHAKVDPVAFVRALRKLQPRLYSISSSPRAHPGQVHLTVGAVRYHHAERARHGVCSTFLCDRATSGAMRVGVFVHPNNLFRPPTNPSLPMIMVGPGTGIAPFRAFLEERRATSATGKNWLFFGDQRAATDYLYRDELAEWMREGLLTRLDTAFSRDQTEKIYVQHRMLEHAAEIYAWLEAGAHFYVCGDASRMAKDVDAALLGLVAAAGGKTPEQATAYVQALKATKRYARDVY